jgi:hypothetical protein
VARWWDREFESAFLQRRVHCEPDFQQDLSVLNNDFAFDDPNGVFPAPSGDLAVDQRPLSAHAAAVQGALGLTAAELTATSRNRCS